jgi:hypothetical protein
MINIKADVFYYNLMLQGHGSEKELALSPLSFEQVCPAWARKLRTALDQRDLRTLAHDSKYCIVGEAWGYNGRHAGYYIAPLIPLIGCWSCVKLGREMGKIAKLHGQSCPSYLHPIINHFLEHWNKKHQDITRKVMHKDNRIRTKRRKYPHK